MRLRRLRRLARVGADGGRDREAGLGWERNGKVSRRPAARGHRAGRRGAPLPTLPGGAEGRWRNGRWGYGTARSAGACGARQQEGGNRVSELAGPGVVWSDAARVHLNAARPGGWVNAPPLASVGRLAFGAATPLLRVKGAYGVAGAAAINDRNCGLSGNHEKRWQRLADRSSGRLHEKTPRKNHTRRRERI